MNGRAAFFAGFGFVVALAISPAVTLGVLALLVILWGVTR